MIALLSSFLILFASQFESKSRLDAENAVFGYQLIILRRKVRAQRPLRTSSADSITTACASEFSVQTGAGSICGWVPGWRKIAMPGQMINTSSSMMPIPITSTASARGS
jgi:hypothetical protein